MRQSDKALIGKLYIFADWRLMRIESFVQLSARHVGYWECVDLDTGGFIRYTSREWKQLGATRFAG